MPDEDRIIAIETKIAFHEDLLQSLNDTVVAQQQRLSLLEQQVKNLVDRVANIHQPGSTEPDPDERPPHY